MQSLMPLVYKGYMDPNGNKFAWGPVKHVHFIGDIAVVEYLKDNSNLAAFGEEAVKLRKREHGMTMFTCYRRTNHTGKWCSLSHSHYTLEMALVHAIAVKYDGINTRAGMYFERMVGDEIHEDWS